MASSKKKTRSGRTSKPKAKKRAVYRFKFDLIGRKKSRRKKK